MTAPDEFLTAAVADVRAFNDVTSVHQLFDRSLTVDEAYGVLDAAEILIRLMPRALVQLSLSVGQSLTVSQPGGDNTTIDAAVAPLAAAAAHMAQAAHFVSTASKSINPLLAEVLDENDDTDDEPPPWQALVATVRSWTSKAHRRHHQAAA
ncbi:hypothetical protein [Mycolicibacterium mageritense]|uniref:hypothetical protein n=1 Tax=Mycolicibacterium mageritense TaxID=53462 RepID=UPI001E4BBAC8|nr:hypothetical protein [Mycolicibacterium mageritense]GJJ24005.1 hypothetical protein MTY414_76790 [Mycolicibacterium mageritense]